MYFFSDGLVKRLEELEKTAELYKGEGTTRCQASFKAFCSDTDCSWSHMFMKFTWFNKFPTDLPVNVALAGLMEHTKRLLRAFFELSQTHRGEFAGRINDISRDDKTIFPHSCQNQNILFSHHNEHSVSCFCRLKGWICLSRIRGCFFCHRRTRTTGRSQRGVCEVCRRSPQHWEIRHPAAKDHQACECTLPHRELCPAC